MLLTEKTCFHRNLDMAVQGTQVIAAWVDWQHEGEEFICTRVVETNGRISDVQRLACSEYSPGKVQVLCGNDGISRLFWTGYRDMRGTLFAGAIDGPTTERVLEKYNFGQFSAALDHNDTIWLAGECWDDHGVIIRLFNQVHEQDWCQFPIPGERGFCRRPVLAVGPEGYIALAWDEYYNGRYRIASAIVRGSKVEFLEPVDASDSWCSLPSIAWDNSGNVYSSYCRENPVELEGGMASYHSRIVFSKLAPDQSKWQTLEHTDIDYGMNPWQAAYVGRRRFSQLVPNPAGGMWALFEEKLEPYTMKPATGRLILHTIGSQNEQILLGGQSMYTCARSILADRFLPVASKTHDFSQQMHVAYHLHLVDPRSVVGDRPAELPSHVSAQPFEIQEEWAEKRPGFENKQLYFGDPHCHSSFSHDIEGELDELYHFARDVSKLDFVAFTENDFLWQTDPLSSEEWSQCRRMAGIFNEPERFTTLVGWEYTKHTAARDE